MAEHGTATIDIDASAEDLFDIVVDLERYPEWVRGMKQIEIHEVNDDGYPARATMTVDAGVKTFTYTLAYEFDPPNLLSWTCEGGDLKQIDGSYAFEVNDDGGTTVTYDLTIDLGYRLPGIMVRRAQQAIMSSALDGLKAHAEA